MSAHPNGRRAPNVSQYLANLNTIPTAQDMAAANDFTLGDDLDFLTNTEFFDFDNFEPHVGDFAAHQQSAGQQQIHTPGHASAMPSQYQFGEFQTYPANMTPASGSSLTSPVVTLSGNFHTSVQFAPDAEVDDQRKASIAGIGSVGDFEEGARVAAEEDKRRRNTAASARFRVKKKQREQALEKQAKDMSDKVQQLESKVQQLEMENKWLKGLITEKGEGKVVDLSSSTSAAAAKHVYTSGLDESASQPSIDSTHTKGVGTKIEL